MAHGSHNKEVSIINKKVKIILGVIATLMIVLNICSVSANTLISKGGYYIKNYDVDIKIDDNNVYKITETIDVFFTEQRHGIYRIIPTSGTLSVIDQKNRSYTAKVKNVSVNTKKTVTNNLRDITIQIGDANKLVEGDVEYIISYDYDLGSDFNPKYDEVYFNIIGSEWDCSMEKVTFRVTMPKEFPIENLGFSVGTLGSVNPDRVTYDVDGLTITGSVDNLEPKEAVTIRCELPQGYFNKRFEDFNKSLIIIIVDTVILGIVASLHILSKLNQKKGVQTVEFYPPENMNSLDVSLIYNGKVEGKDVTSLLIYLANKGYIKIDENKNGCTFIKLKEYDGENSEERNFMRGLFLGKDSVTLSSVTYRFHSTQTKILEGVNGKKHREKYIKKGDGIYKAICIIALLIVFFNIALTLGLKIENKYDFQNNFTFALIGMIPLSGYVVIKQLKSKTQLKSICLMFGFFWLAFGLVFSFLSNIFDPFNYIDVAAILYSLLCTIIIIILGVNIYFRTKEGIKLNGRIRGFKKFLENAKKEELEDLVLQYPNYFYDILPYTYVLGISDKWISKFENINKQRPDWYNSQEDMDSKEIVKRINSVYKSSATTFSKVYVQSSSSDSSSSSSHSSSSHSSGGGSSGRGSGGGGGGSW